MAPPKKQNKLPDYFKRFHHVIGYCGRGWSVLARGGSKVLSWLRRLPRPLKLVSIYLVVGMVAGGIFLWQMWSLKAAYPYITGSDPELKDSEGRLSDEGGDIPVDTRIADQLAEGEGLMPELEEWREYPMENSSPSLSLSNPGKEGIWPVSGTLWYRYHEPVTQKLNEPYVKHRFSKGLAIKSEPGSEVYAVWEGIVVKVSEHGYPYGWGVTLKHDNGLTTYYGALQNVAVDEEVTIDRGKRIGYLAGGGEEGVPPHLYLEVRENRETVDPLQYLP